MLAAEAFSRCKDGECVVGEPFNEPFKETCLLNFCGKGKEDKLKSQVKLSIQLGIESNARPKVPALLLSGANGEPASQLQR